MADDKRDGDDLFEDLDKFFAPIKDVDWDEPASAGARETPTRSTSPFARRRPAVTRSRQSEPEPSPSRPRPLATPSADDEDDEDWYDTTVLDTIEGIAVGDELPSGPSDTVVELDDPMAGERRCPETASRSSRCRSRASGTVRGWRGGRGRMGRAAIISEQVVGELETETAPMATIEDIVEEEVVMTTAPSDEDLEAAAEHFAPSVREEADIALEDDDVVGGVVGFEEDESSSSSPPPQRRTGRRRPPDDEEPRHPGRSASRRGAADRHGRQHRGSRRPQLAGLGSRGGRCRHRAPRPRGRRA